MENEFTDFLNQNWNDKFKSGVTSSSLHLNASGSGGGGGGGGGVGAPNASALNHAILQQYHQQTLRAANSSSSSTSSSAAAAVANYENIRLAFMQHRHSTTNAGHQQASQHGTVAVNSATAATASATASATTNPSHPIQRNPSTTATCPKLIDIHSIKGNNPSLPYDCQSKYSYSTFRLLSYGTRSIPLSLSLSHYFLSICVLSTLTVCNVQNMTGTILPEMLLNLTYT